MCYLLIGYLHRKFPATSDGDIRRAISIKCNDEDKLRTKRMKKEEQSETVVDKDLSLSDDSDEERDG